MRRRINVSGSDINTMCRLEKLAGGSILNKIRELHRGILKVLRLSIIIVDAT